MYTETELSTYTATTNCMVYLSLYAMNTDVVDYIIKLNDKVVGRLREFCTRSSTSVYPLTVYMHTGDILTTSGTVYIRSVIAFS